MRKRQVLISATLLLLGTGMATAQKAYTYVQQDGTKIEGLGTAAFELSADSHPTVEFVDGKAVMTIGDNTVAKLPMSDKGQLVVEFETTMEESDLNKVTKNYTTPFATLYSPFQLTVPTGQVEVYAPTYDETSHELLCTTTTLIGEDAVIPVETALILKNAGTAEFAIASGASTATQTSALSGSSLNISVPTVESGNTLYTLGHETNDNTKYGFFSYTGTTLGAGLAWLEAPTFTQSARKYVAFNFGETTAINNVDASTGSAQAQANGKYLENGRIVIVKEGKKYNVNAQEVK